MSSSQLVTQHVIFAEVKVINSNAASLQFLSQLVKFEMNGFEWQFILFFTSHANGTWPNPWIKQRKQNNPAGFILKKLLDALDRVDIVSLMAELARSHEAVHVSLKKIKRG